MAEKRKFLFCANRVKLFNFAKKFQLFHNLFSYPNIEVYMFSASDVTFDNPSYYVNPPAFGFQTPKLNAAFWYFNNYERENIKVKPDQENIMGLKTVIVSLGRTTTYLNMSIARTDMELEFIAKVLSYFPLLGAISGIYHLYQATQKHWEPTENWNEKKLAHIVRGGMEVLTLGFLVVYF